MKLPQGQWDGAQPRTHVLAVLRRYGVQVTRLEADNYELIDCEGDPLVLHIPSPVPRELIPFLYRRFGHLHGFEITALVRKKPG